MEIYRIEKKFIIKNSIGEKELNSLIRIRQNFIPRIVSSIYFDTYNFELAKANLRGDLNRIKIRVRWYDNNMDDLYLEFKIKKNIFTKKISYKLKAKIEQIDNHLIKNLIHQDKKLKEIQKYMPIANIFPVARINYHRNYYKIENSRLTFDKNLNFNLIGKSNKTYIDKSRIIELKVDEKNETQLKRLQDFIPALETRSSKYILALKSIYNLQYF